MERYRKSAIEAFGQCRRGAVRSNTPAATLQYCEQALNRLDAKGSPLADEFVGESTGEPGLWHAPGPVLEWTDEMGKRVK